MKFYHGKLWFRIRKTPPFDIIKAYGKFKDEFDKPFERDVEDDILHKQHKSFVKIDGFHAVTLVRSESGEEEYLFLGEPYCLD